ncbi:MAG: c-type cytochrome [Pyrinomonadaceae bacterium]
MHYDDLAIMRKVGQSFMETRSMQINLKLCVGVVFLFAVAFMLLTRETHATSAGSTSSGAGSPRTLYVQNCARCHGANGKSQTDLGMQLDADDLTTSSASTSKIIGLITNGRGDMPGFKKKLTAGQISSIARYVKSL